MTSTQTEAEVLNTLIPELEAEGYEVFVHPNPSRIPDFLGEFQPDIIAYRGDRNLIVEIKHNTSKEIESAKKIAKLVEGRAGWDFRLIWIRPTSSADLLPTQSKKAILEQLESVRRLLEAGDIQAGFLLAWATYEATARAVNPIGFARPQTPGRIIEILARDGIITPTTADMLRRLAQQRTRLIHGDLSQTLRPEDLIKFLDVISTLADQVEAN